MQEKVLAYLEEQRKKQEEKKTVAEQWARQEQEEKLLKLGLWTPEYAPEGEETKEIRNVYPLRDEEGRRYKKVVVPVTEEEWAAIQAAAAADSDVEKVKAFGERWRNPVSRILWRVALVFFVGGGILALLSMLLIGAMEGLTSLLSAIGIMVSAGMAGLALMAVAEIIQLLDKSE